MGQTHRFARTTSALASAWALAFGKSAIGLLNIRHLLVRFCLFRFCFYSALPASLSFGSFRSDKVRLVYFRGWSLRLIPFSQKAAMYLVAVLSLMERLLAISVNSLLVKYVGSAPKCGNQNAIVFSHFDDFIGEYSVRRLSYICSQNYKICEQKPHKNQTYL